MVRIETVFCDLDPCLREASIKESIIEGEHFECEVCERDFHKECFDAHKKNSSECENAKGELSYTE